MKKLVVIAALGLVAVGGLAQGQFTFGNKNTLTTPPITAQVKNSDGSLLAGTDFLAQAYVKLAADPESSYAPVGSAVSFRTGANAGYIVSKIESTGFAGGTAITVQMRAWEASGGNSYAAAQAAGKKFGKSNDVPLTVTVAPATPPDMVGLQGFSLVPEPSTLALGVLGAAALLIRRRS
jgi:hypothetical protein